MNDGSETARRADAAEGNEPLSRRVDPTRSGSFPPGRGAPLTATAASLYAVLGGGVTLAGWALGIPRLTDWQGNGISMKGNAAVCAFLAGVGVLAVVWRPERRSFIRAIGVLVSLVGGLTLFEHVAGVDLGIDTLVFDEPPGAPATAAPGRMGVPGSLSFAIVGVALAFMTLGSRTRRWAPGLGIATLCIVALPLVGYLYGASQLYAVARFTGIAWQTATMLALLGVGVIAAVPEHGLAAVLRIDNAGGMVLRRLMPAIVAFPIAVGWLHLLGEKAGFYDSAFGTAGHTVVEISLLVGMLWWTAGSIGRHARTARLAERALRQNEARLAAFLEQLPVGCCLTDLNGHALVRNRMMQRFAAEGLIPSPQGGGPRYWQSWDPGGGALPPADWPTARALRGETVNPGVDFIYTGDDGRQTWTRISSTPFHDEGGVIVGAITVVEDIDARKRANESLREREALLRTVTTESNVGLVIIDERRCYLFANTTYAKILGLPERDIVGMRVEDVLGPLYTQVRPRLDQAFTGERVRFELNLPVHPITKQEHFYDVSYEPRLTGSSASHVTEVIADVTVRKQAETTLREADHRKDEFLAMLAHELRNPLAPLRSGLALLRRNRGGDVSDANTEVQAMMERQLAHMVRLVDDLIDVNRVNRGKIELRKAPTELATILESAVETSSPLLRSFGHELVVRQPEGPIVLDADLTRLAQVFANLLNNAAKYTRPGGHIHVDVERQDAAVVVHVRDDGVGIPAAMLPTIFDTFTQVDTSLERSRGGLGIGLTVVKRLVEMHGGDVTAFSPPPRGDRDAAEGDRQGSEFVVRLPTLPPGTVAEIAPPPASAPPPPALPQTPLDRLRVLVADDNTDGAEMMGLLLGDLGAETRITYDGRAALDEAAAFLPDVALLDIGMPKLNGYEVARMIRAAGWGQRIVLVALTGWGQPDDRNKSLAAGFDHHLVKPIDVQALEKLLARVKADGRGPS